MDIVKFINPHWGTETSHQRSLFQQSLNQFVKFINPHWGRKQRYCIICINSILITKLN